MTEIDVPTMLTHQDVPPESDRPLGQSNYAVPVDESIKLNIADPIIRLVVTTDGGSIR